MPGNRDKLIAYLEEQGATVRKTKKGLWIQTQLGTTSVHNTPSDRRAVDNEIAAFRRLGLLHPDDNKHQVEYPAYITQGKPQAKTMEKFRKYLHENGWPLEVLVRDLRDYGDNVTVTRNLYWAGYRHKPGSRRNRYTWVAPDDIVKLHEDLKAREVANEKVQSEPDVEIVASPPLKVREEPVKDQPEDPSPVRRRDDGSEFIDTHDSWTVNLSRPDPTLAQASHVPEEVRKYIAGLHAAGLGVEIRVWRKNA